MGIQISQLLRVEFSIPQGIAHCSGTTLTIFCRSGYVKGICAHTETKNFTINLHTSGLSALVFFQHQHTGTLPQNEAVTIFIPGSARLLRLVIAARQRPHGCKSRHGYRRSRSLCSANDHNVCITVLDHASPNSNVVGTRRTGCDHGNIRPPKTILNRDVARDHVDHDTGHKKRGDSARAAFEKSVVGRFNGIDTPDSRTNSYANSICITRMRLDASILYCLRRSGDA